MKAVATVGQGSGNVAKFVLGAVAFAIIAGGLYVMTINARAAHAAADRQRAEEIAAESAKYCAKWGQQTTLQEAACIADLGAIRARQEQRIREDIDIP